jgi:hypothetical protein
MLSISTSESIRVLEHVRAGGITEWMVDPRGIEAHCDITIPTGFGGKSPWTLGFIDLRSIGSEQTQMKVGILKMWEKHSERRPQQWFRFAKGEYACE